MNFTVPNFKTRKELYKFLIDNKDTLIAQKKSAMKWGDCVPYLYWFEDEKGNTVKANKPIDTTDLKTLKVKVVINTTNIMDSHYDVHLKKIWNKSIRENKNIKFLQEHEMSFANVIADKANLKVYVQEMKWSELGQKYDGTTEALVFEATIDPKRSPAAKFMLEQYANGYVDNHSVGMFYVELFLCINDSTDEYWEEEFKNWGKYVDEIVNKDMAEEVGYFWAVKIAKCMEGSAVVVGSNQATPTLDNNLQDDSTGKRHVNPEHKNEDTQPSSDIANMFNYLTENFSLT